MLKEKIISHAPEAPYFDESQYKKGGGYMTVHKEVGSFTDFYTVEYFNQMSLKYDTYETLFEKSDPTTSLLGTSVGELIQRGIPNHKIVIGKPASSKDVQNTGLVDP